MILCRTGQHFPRVLYKEGMEIGYGIEKELCFHPDPRVLFSPSVKKSARKRMEEGDNVNWERVHNSGA